MQFYTVSQTSLAKSGSSVVEEYLPLWFSDGAYVGMSATGTTWYYLQDGASTVSSSSPTSMCNLFTLNPNWNPSQKYALEATIWSSSGSARLYDITTSSAVTNSTITTTSQAATVMRSSQFTLIPGHVYGVQVQNQGASINLSDASLIVFGQ